MSTHDATAASAMYCRKCNYALWGLSENRCPECGRPFDPADPATYRTRPNEGHVLRWAKRVLLSLLVLATLLGIAFGLMYWRWRVYQGPALQQLGGQVGYGRIGPPWLADLLGSRFAYLLNRPSTINLQNRSWSKWGWGQGGSPVPRTTSIAIGTLAAIGKIPSLRSLGLAGTTVDDDGLWHLRQLTDLRTLDLTATGISDRGLAYLVDLGEMTWLYLADTDVSDAGLTHLQNMRHLENLDLSNTKVTDAGLATLANLTSLQWLSLRGTSVTDAGLEQLRSLPHLRQIHLEKTQVTRAGIRKLQQALPNVKIWITDIPVAKVPLSLPAPNLLEKAK